jgi:hypothetical protein
MLPRAVMRDIVDLSLELAVVKTSLMLTAQLCPGELMQGKVCNWVTSADIRAMRSSDRFKTQGKEANKMMQKASVGMTETPPQHVLLAYLNLLARTGRWLLGKKHASFEEHVSLVQLKQLFDEDKQDQGKAVQDASGADKGGETPVGTKATSVPQSKNVVQYKPDGSVHDPKRELAEAGLSRGVYVCGKVYGLGVECPACDVDGVHCPGGIGCPGGGNCARREFTMGTGWVSDLSTEKMTITLISEGSTKQKVTITYDQYKKDWKLQYDKEAIQDKGIVANWHISQIHRRVDWA